MTGIVPSRRLGGRWRVPGGGGLTGFGGLTGGGGCRALDSNSELRPPRHYPAAGWRASVGCRAVAGAGRSIRAPSSELRPPHQPPAAGWRASVGCRAVAGVGRSTRVPSSELRAPSSDRPVTTRPPVGGLRWVAGAVAGVGRSTRALSCVVRGPGARTGREGRTRRGPEVERCGGGRSSEFGALGQVTPSQRRGTGAHSVPSDLSESSVSRRWKFAAPAGQENSRIGRWPGWRGPAGGAP